MTLTFYHVPYSTSNSTSAVFAELNYGLAKPLETRVILSIEDGDTRKASFQSLNPNARVPTIVHDGVSIWESAAVNMYLGEMFGTNPRTDGQEPGGQKEELYPSLGPKRGEAMKWIVWTNMTIAEAGGRLARALPPRTDGGVEEGSVDMPDKDITVARRAEDKEKALKDLTKWLAVLDGGLDGRKYILGDSYSLADTHMWSFVRWLGFMKVSLEPFANVTGWLKRVGERPALKKEIGGA